GHPHRASPRAVRLPFYLQKSPSRSSGSLPPATRAGARARSQLGTEVGLALFAEGLGALLRFLTLVIERQRLETECADAANGLAGGIERAFGDGQRRRALLVNLLAPFGDLGVQLVVRHHDVAQAHLQCFLGAVAAAQIPDFARLLLADHAGEIGGAET